MKRRHFLAALLAVTMLFSLLSLPAMAENDGTAESGPAGTGEETLPDPEATPVPDDTAAPAPDETPAPDAEASPTPDAEATPAPESTATPVPDSTAEPAPGGEAYPPSDPSADPSPADAVQALIDALPDPENITAETRADVEAQLAAIDQAKLALSDDERAALDTSRYMAAAALLTLDSQAGADEPMAIVETPAFSGGSGTADEPYQISSAADLRALRDSVNSGERYAGQYFLLTADIDLGGEAWTPIGNSPVRFFEGTFDGGSHLISGLAVGESGEYAGLFGRLDRTDVGGSPGGTVKSLGVAGTVRGGAYTGGVVGLIKYGTVTNCYNAATVTGSGNTGGIVGQNDSGTVTGCYNTGAVTGGGGSTGGIAGETRDILSNCYNTGTVNSSGPTGGIAGSVSSSISSCYNTGAVTGPADKTGEIAGDTRSSVSNCYYPAGSPNPGCGATGYALDADQTSARSDVEFRFLASSLGEGWVDSVEGRPVRASNKEAEEAGTETTPLELPDAATLKAFRDYANANDCTGKFFKLTADIDLGGEAWTPIGTFNGTFDGGGHEISGLVVNESGGNAGLFGYIGGKCTVKNLGVSGTVTGDNSDNVGGIVGHCQGGKVINCHSAVTVTGTDSLGRNGGIVGYNYTGTVTGCYNTGTVKGICYTGGIVGSNEGTVTLCYNTGKVTSDQYAGGITGDNASGTKDCIITDCYNTGDIASSSHAGGIAGSIGHYGTVTNCYNTGKVTGSGSFTGSVAGSVTTGSLRNSYFLEGTAPSGISSGYIGDADLKTAGEFHFLASSLGDQWVDSVEGRPVLRAPAPQEAAEAGAADTPFEIPDLATLKAFREYANANDCTGKHFKLTADIGLDGEEWAPIAPDLARAFQGTFDGGGHTVSGLSITAASGYVGFFGVIGEGGTVKGLTASGAISATDKDAEVGTIAGENLGTIENCVSAVSITADTRDAGGITGYNDGSITGCGNTGNIDASGNAGGIAGDSGSYSPVEDCYNTGAVSSSGDLARVGGIVGYHHYGNIIRCRNSGPVTAASTGNAGGILGFHAWHAPVGGTVYYTVEDCYNTGTVASGGSTGGIAGYSCNVKDCYNTGTVRGASVSGGIVAEETPQCFVENSYYLDACGAGGTGTEMTAERFASGEVAHLLQGSGSGPVWGQTVGEDGAPVLTGDPAKQTYAVTFVMDEAHRATAYANPGGTVPSLPEALKREGYTFVKWSLTRDAAGGSFTASTPVNGDMTVYAIYALQPTASPTPSAPSTAGGSATAPGPQASGTSSASAPDTGDESQPALWLALLTLSLAGLVLALGRGYYTGRRRQR